MKRKDAYYRISVLTVPEEVPETVTDVRLIYVLDGACQATLGGESVEMNKWDSVVVNSMEAVTLRFSREDVVALISIDYIMLCDALNTYTVRFALNSQEASGLKYTQVREQIQELLMAHVGHEFAYAYREMGCFYLLLQTLLSEFLVKSRDAEGEGGEVRVAKMIRYIRSNYSTNLTLNEIADQLYLSPSTASRLFQKTTGKKFVTYIKDVRLEYVRQQLVNTDHSITRIAADNGFSTPSALNKIFKSEFGITPKEYRERNARPRPQTQPESEGEGESANREKLLHILLEDRKLQAEQRRACQTVRCQVRDMRPWRRWENRVLNVGPAHILSSASMQKQVLFLAEQLEIEYLRVWNIFSPRMMMVGPKGEYNFTFVDEVMDFCVDHRLKLFLDLAQRRDVAMASESREIYRNEEYTVFADATEWSRMLDALLRHIRRRYHEWVVGQWIFEFTFFLNDQPYYISDTYSSKDAWETGWQLVKNNIPSARVAGMGLASGAPREQTELLTSYLLETKHRPDIFTVMVFPYTVEGSLLSGGLYRSQFKKVASRGFLLEQITIIRKTLDEMNYQGELWVTDWGNSLANRNYIQDSCFRGAFLLENYLACQDKVDSLGVFYASDLLNAFFDSKALLSGSAGILSRTGICKPAYFAYRFLSRLGRFRIAQSENCIVTAESDHDIRILCFNNKALGPKYYLYEENVYRPDELSRLFVSTAPLSMELTIRMGQEQETYTVRQKVLNEHKGSILNKWIDFGCSTHLSRSDMRYLERTSTPEITMERVSSVEGVVRISLQLEPNEIRFITIMRE